MDTLPYPMINSLTRAALFPEPALPDFDELIAEGRQLAKTVVVGPCPFFDEYGVASESEYKRQRMAEGAVMLHAHLGFREAAKSQRACAEIHESINRAGHRIDRYGICLDWSMGYPRAMREGMPKGTGLILDDDEAFAAITGAAPVAPHFGDFVMGTPAALENTAGALKAGSTAIGNLGQYFTFDMPGWDDDVATTSETVKALALIAAQPVEVIVQSNLDDGFAALFCDLTSALGMVLIERFIVEDLIGGRTGHCYGHTFTNPVTRLAFQRALARQGATPGTMVYGNTTAYGANEAANYAALAGYLLVDIHGQRSRPTGHAINPVPVTEAQRIPEIDEIIDAQLFANRLIERGTAMAPLINDSAAEAVADDIVAGGERFRSNVLEGLEDAGVDTRDPFELLLAIRRIGAKRLEEMFGAGEPEDSIPRGRQPMVRSDVMDEIENAGRQHLDNLDDAMRTAIRGAGLTACTATTDVHEYGKLAIDAVLGELGVAVIDGGVSTDPDKLAARARDSAADFIALSTFNGVALGYLKALKREMAAAGVDVPVFIGGRLNQIPEASNTSLPVDVGDDLANAGAVVCRGIGDMLPELSAMATAKD